MEVRCQMPEFNCVQSIHIVVIQYTLRLSQLSVFIAVAMNTDGFFSYQCIRFIFSMIELRIFSVIEPVLLLHV